jgi:Acetoacetate decarboxylase (ADC)
MAVDARTYRFEGRDFRLPCAVRDASAGSATWLVPAAAARRLLPGPELEIAEVLPGRGLLSIAIIDYKDNDLGDYDEVSIAFFVRPRGEPAGLPWLGNWAAMGTGRLGVYIRHLPVNQSFTCEAGRTIWGYPKSVQQIEFEAGGARARCRLVYEGEHALTLSVPRGGSRSMPVREMRNYSMIDGALHLNRADSGADGFGMQLGGAELELGTGAIADELRSLGLPRRALMTTWMERMYGTFGPAEKL